MERKNKKKYVTLVCKVCEKEFQKELREYNRVLKNRPNSNFYCSSKCCLSRVQTDEFSPFRGFLTVSKRSSRNKNLKFDLDLKYLKDLWDGQNGKCFYTGIEMFLAKTIDYKEFKPNSASLDRIDSSKGYVKGNVKFVCLSINYAKNSFDETDFVNFLSKVINGGK